MRRTWSIDLAFVVPNYDWWEAPFYGLGLKLYELLAGKYGFGKSRLLSREETLQRIPTLKPDGLRGGAIYYDGQFDDARLLIHMVFTAFEQGATLLNYVEVTGFTQDSQDFVNGILARDVETGEELHASAKVVINATGAFSGSLRGKKRCRRPPPMIKPSQGIHLVFGPEFLQATRCAGSAHQRRAGTVCHSLARPHSGWNHRHACCQRRARADSDGAGDRIRSRDRRAVFAESSQA